MSIQTEIKNEKAMFDILVQKIKASKTIKKEEDEGGYDQLYSFDTFEIRIIYDLDLCIHGYQDLDSPTRAFSVEDKSIRRGWNKRNLVWRTCSVSDLDEGDELELSKVRYQGWKKLVDAISERMGKRIDARRVKAEKARERARELELAKAKLKVMESRRKQRECDAVQLKMNFERLKNL